MERINVIRKLISGLPAESRRCCIISALFFSWIHVRLHALSRHTTQMYKIYKKKQVARACSRVIECLTRRKIVYKQKKFQTLPFFVVIVVWRLLLLARCVNLVEFKFQNSLRANEKAISSMLFFLTSFSPPMLFSFNLKFQHVAWRCR